MKISSFISLFFLCIWGCAKMEQYNETSCSSMVVDLTTGNLGKDVSVSLLEQETPATPFSSIILKEIDQKSVHVGESFQFNFNAKRGERFEYIVQFNRGLDSYSSGRVLIQDELGYKTAYEMVESCTLTKKVFNECVLKIEPTCYTTFRVENIPPSANDIDSIWVDFHDGYLHKYISFRGIGSSPSSTLEMPHGYYTLSYTVYNNGIEQYSNSYPVELKHNRDTSIVVEF